MPADVTLPPDVLDGPPDDAAYAGAEVVIGTRCRAPWHCGCSRRRGGAGCDAVDLAALPGTAVVCNRFGHEQAIADADARLRHGDRACRAGTAARAHGELAGSAVGLLGFRRSATRMAVRASDSKWLLTVVGFVVSGGVVHVLDGASGHPCGWRALGVRGLP